MSLGRAELVCDNKSLRNLRFCGQEGRCVRKLMLPGRMRGEQNSNCETYREWRGGLGRFLTELLYI